jgi:hypothetical protein
MGQFKESIRHDGGTYNVEVDLEGDQAVIRFGASFTLRLDEKNIDKLRDLLYEASRGLTAAKWDRSWLALSCNAEQDTVELPRVHTAAEDDFVQAGVEAREQQKLNRMMKGTASPISNDPIDW